MKIAVLGAGAMGSLYGALFARAGHEVWLLDRWAEHVEAVRRDGLRVEGASGSWEVRPRAATEPTEAGPCDLVIVATKTRDLAAALSGVGPLLRPDTALLCIQNGLGAAELVARLVPPERALLGIAGGFGASIPAPGSVHHNGWELVRIGAPAAAGGEAAERVAALWTAAGFKAEPAADIEAMIWAKLICNAAYSALCCVTGLRMGEVLADPEASALSAACAREAWTVARAKGIDPGFDDPVAQVRAFGAAIPRARPSVLLDRLAGRPSEIDFINGAVPREAEKLGLTAPTNALLAALVRTMEAGDLRPPERAAAQDD